MRLEQQGPSLLAQAPAKLNLSLNVLGRRQDGYHLLETLMVSVQLYDSLRFDPAESDELTLTATAVTPASTPLPVDDRNLILKAAQLLRAETGTNLGARIHLTKRIPSEAGMGGGSSDAATTLVALNQFWKLDLSHSQLHALAARLGSDINFFLENAPAAVCTGRGELVSPRAMCGPLHFVVVKPQSGLSTREVFQTWAKAGSGETSHTLAELETQLANGAGNESHWPLRNDLQPAAEELNPEVRGLLHRLRTVPSRGALLTGSGSACFLLCRSARHAAWVSGQVRSWRVGQVFAVRSGV